MTAGPVERSSRTAHCQGPTRIFSRSKSQPRARPEPGNARARNQPHCGGQESAEKLVSGVPRKGGEQGKRRALHQILDSLPSPNKGAKDGRRLSASSYSVSIETAITPQTTKSQAVLTRTERGQGTKWDDIDFDQRFKGLMPAASPSLSSTKPNTSELHDVSSQLEALLAMAAAGADTESMHEPLEAAARAVRRLRDWLGGETVGGGLFDGTHASDGFARAEKGLAFAAHVVLLKSLTDWLLRARGDPVGGGAEDSKSNLSQGRRSCATWRRRLRREVVRCLSIVASSSGKAASVLAHTHAPLILALCSVSCPTHENLALSLASEKEEGAEGGTPSTASALDEEAAFWALGTLSVLLASASARALSLSQFHSILHFGLSSLSQSVRGICG